MKVAIVHDWLIGGGAEKVVEQLHKMYPEAPIYTSYCTAEWRHRLDGKVVTGWLQHWPFSRLRKFIPFLRVWWFSRLDLSGYDLVISSSGAEAKFVKIKKPAVHVAYIHAPTHYYWNRYDEYLKTPGFGLFNPLARLSLRVLVGPLRQLDYRAAQRPDQLVANSNYTKEQIKKYYGRDSVVIHPPVDVGRFAAAAKVNYPRKGFIISGRQTPYKRFDLAVAACTQLNLPLVVIGNGPDHRRLVKMAGKSVTFLTKVTDKELPERLAKAQAFIFPGVDDFGISAVEALAAGTPVIAYKGGGALDYVQAGKTGAFFTEQSADSLIRALRNFKPGNFDNLSLSSAAKEFTPLDFNRKIKELIK